jgi:hypothetical protein
MEQSDVLIQIHLVFYGESGEGLFLSARTDIEMEYGFIPPFQGS